jgi:hypothetical protein
MLIRFEAICTEEERLSALERAIEKAGPAGYIIEPRCCNVCGDERPCPSGDFGNDNNAPLSVIKLTKFQCRLCGVYYNMCDECIDDQYENPERTKCPRKYGCRNNNVEPYIFITKPKNLVKYDAFGVQVCREYTDDETTTDEIGKVMVRGMVDVLCTYYLPDAADFLFYVYHVKNHPDMRKEARDLRGLALAKVIRPALGNYVMDHVLKPIIQREVETERDWARFGILDHKNISDLWSYHITNIDCCQPELLKKLYGEPKRKIYELASWSEYQYYNTVKRLFVDFIELDQSGTEDGKPLMLSFCWANGDEFHIRRRYEPNENDESFEEVFIPFSIVTDWEVPPFCRFSRKPRFIHSRQVHNDYHLKTEDAVMCFVSRVVTDETE